MCDGSVSDLKTSTCNSVFGREVLPDSRPNFLFCECYNSDMKYRTVVVGVVQNKAGEYLLCKKPVGEGIYPGQWALPGGGIDEGETMEQALKREMMEEVGLQIDEIKPLFFRDDTQPKYKNGVVDADVYMVYLLFSCRATNEVKIDNREFEDFAWVKINDIADYDLNVATRNTFERIGVLISQHTHDAWVAHPTGAIPKGMFCDVCKRYNVRNTTVQLIAVRDGKVLLQKRNLDPEKGAWALVAGYLSWDETIEEAMKRELKEEMGLEVENLSLVAVYSDPARDKDGRQNIAVVFSGEVAGELVIDSREVKEVAWFDLHELPEMIAFDHRQMINEYASKSGTKN